MKKKQGFFSNLVFNLVMLCAVFLTATGFGAPAPVAMVAVGAGLVYTMIPDTMHMTVVRNEVLRKLFLSNLQSALFPANTFLDGVATDNAAAPGADANSIVTIEIPQDENTVETVVNPSVFPLEVGDQTDGKLTYSGSLIVSKPVRVGDLNQAQYSYDKRAAKLRLHVNTIQDEMAKLILNGWCPTNSTFIIPTTGSNRPASGVGATGNRKAITEADILSLKLLFDNANVPQEGRRLLINGQMENDLLVIERFTSVEKYGPNTAIMMGEIGRIHGFRIIKRSIIQSYDSSNVLKPFGAAAATSDQAAALAYHPDFVRYIKGTAMVYLDSQSRPEYVGKLMNAAIYGGGTFSRNSQIGVAALYEDN